MVERFWEKVDKSGECWLWTASLDKDGYGQFHPNKRQLVKAHRMSWSLLVGPIPPGHDLHHEVCSNRACVRPDHLRPMPHREHVATGSPARNAAKTQCPKGHAYDEANTYRDKLGRRYCRKCRNIGSAIIYARRRAAKP